MKLNKIIVSMLLACSLSTGLYAQEAVKAPDFGSVNFGDSIDTVKAAEKDCKMLLEKEEYIIFEEESDGLKSQNIYEFKEGKLETGLVNIITEHKTLAEIIDEYNNLNAAFKQIYGEPNEESINVQDEALLKDNEKLAKAVQDGTASLNTVWIKENFTVTHSLINTLPTEDFDEETQKLLVKAPLCHLFIGANGNGADEEVEEGENADEAPVENAEDEASNDEAAEAKE